MIYLRIFEEFSRNYSWKKCADCNSENPEIIGLTIGKRLYQNQNRKNISVFLV